MEGLLTSNKFSTAPDILLLYLGASAVATLGLLAPTRVRYIPKIVLYVLFAVGMLLFSLWTLFALLDSTQFRPGGGTLGVWFAWLFVLIIQGVLLALVKECVTAPMPERRLAPPMYQ